MPTVDHCIPRSYAVGLAYEWSNFRLASHLMNTRKGDHLDVLDPFEVEDGWFVIEEFMELKVAPGANLPPETTAKVKATIGRLQLNSVECLRMRQEHYDGYVCREATLSSLMRLNPFLALELIRQNMLRPEDRVHSI
ncbi:MAG: hypothetical protein AAFS10_01710 [Myxococcota bacterium]